MSDCVPDSWVQRGLKKVGDQTGNDYDSARKKCDRLHDGVVASLDRLHEQRSKTGDAEDLLDHGSASDEESDDDRDDGDRRGHSISKCVPSEHTILRVPTRSGRLDVLAVEHALHTRTQSAEHNCDQG